MKANIILVLLLIYPLSVFSLEEKLLKKIPSTEFTELAKIAPERFLNLDQSVDERISLFYGSWSRAINAPPVDNRAYLFALAIDLYNSIPPDLMPKPQELAPGEDIYEPNLRPIKQQLYDDIRFIDKNPAHKKFSLEKNEKLLSRYKRKLSRKFEENSSEWKLWLSDYFELKYLGKYIREQVTQGNIIIDMYNAPASLNFTEIELLNPKYYSQLHAYMESVQPRIDAHIPPWEDAEDLPPPENKETSTKPVVKQQEVSPTPELEVKISPVRPESPANPDTNVAKHIEPTNSLPVWLYIAATGIVAIVIVLSVLRKKPRV